MVLLLSAAVAVACCTRSPVFVAILVIYFICGALYSFTFKAIACVDVLVLVLLYMLRICAGGALAQVWLSQSLTVFAFFVFASIALAKRHSELVRLRRTGCKASTIVPGRGYAISDIWFVETLGITCGVLSVLTLSIYLRSTNVARLYQCPSILWVLCPVLVFWIGRLWLVSARGMSHDDPVRYFITDLPTLVAAVLAFGVVRLSLLPCPLCVP